ncbi:MAG: hypothetical protein KTR26_07440 [Flammeovirgaceae bacterium]|nr:hypothetical protein [Flammeovirgaceae bacterium]
MKTLIFLIIPVFYFFNLNVGICDPEYAIIETKSGEKIEAEINTFEEGIIISGGSKLHYSIEGEKHKINYKEIKRKITITHIAELIVDESVKLYFVFEVLTSHSDPSGMMGLS